MAPSQVFSPPASSWLHRVRHSRTHSQERLLHTAGPPHRKHARTALSHQTFVAHRADTARCQTHPEALDFSLGKPHV